MAGFSKDSARRVGRSVRKAELATTPRHGHRAAGPVPTAPARWFRTNATIAAAVDDGTTVTQPAGLATLLGGPRPDLGDNATLTDLGYDPIYIHNGLNGSIDAGKLVLCLWVGGMWVIDLVWCG